MPRWGIIADTGCVNNSEWYSIFKGSEDVDDVVWFKRGEALVGNIKIKRSFMVSSIGDPLSFKLRCFVFAGCLPPNVTEVATDLGV
jgi:hypothetical protein